jgi:hypothetical protein
MKIPNTETKMEINGPRKKFFGFTPCSDRFLDHQEAVSTAMGAYISSNGTEGQSE